MVFFTPDLAHYSEDLRGFYFDLLAEAPGPVVQTRDELRDAILEAEAHRPGFEARAAAPGRERFTPHDDGRAGDRVVTPDDRRRLALSAAQLSVRECRPRPSRRGRRPSGIRAPS